MNNNTTIPYIKKVVYNNNNNNNNNTNIKINSNINNKCIIVPREYDIHSIIENYSKNKNNIGHDNIDISRALFK